MGLENVKKLSREEMRIITAGKYVERQGGVCVSTSSCSSGCAVTSDGETGVCDNCCYA